MSLVAGGKCLHLVKPSDLFWCGFLKVTHVLIIQIHIEEELPDLLGFCFNRDITKQFGIEDLSYIVDVDQLVLPVRPVVLVHKGGVHVFISKRWNKLVKNSFVLVVPLLRKSKVGSIEEDVG